LAEAALDETVRTRAVGTFARLAAAEAAVHGGDADDVHFHEVGALDAIVDVVGVCAGLVELQRRGLTTLHASPVAVGAGRVKTAHGSLPVPAPAVVALLRGAPTYAGPGRHELCTPTGAALLAEWVDAWGGQPPMAVTVTGTGAGGRDPAGHPNVVRLLIGEEYRATDRHPQALLLECNVDDLDPRLWPLVLDRLLDAGASDAWLTPILMKKGRPAHQLSVLVTADRAVAVEDVVFTETTTIGLRHSPVGKEALDRRTVTVAVDGLGVDVKVAVLDGRVVNVQPEYEHVAAVAAATRQPVKVVLARAVACARDLW
ncbi:MAG: nickel pincer cofactor biosynthesis protein LarC, partial [Actinomycetota bacterium]|nr:nickel pincer cofactor biosynthesis protein LarC [Actinomycetota bacterium]